MIADLAYRPGAPERAARPAQVARYRQAVNSILSPPAIHFYAPHHRF
jgi:hypothetical protein